METIIFDESAKDFSISRIVRDSDYTMPNVHLHYNEYEIYYLLEGERYYFIGTKIYHVIPGTLLFIHPNVIHKTGIVKEAYHDRILLEISHSLLDKILSCAGELKLSAFFQAECLVFNLNIKEQHLIKNLLFSIVDEMKSKKRGWRLMLQNRLAELLVFAIRCENVCSASDSHNAKPSIHKQAERIAAYLLKHYTEPLTLASVAKHFYINKCYLSRIFKESTGFTVLTYLHTCRIQKACDLLIHNDMNISSVSEAVGYENLTYFERIFKKHTGTSPLQYRKQFCKSLF